MKNEILSTLDKAFNINHDEKIYGTFAEIGAGQEVARQFFEAGKASGTIAKTISAYDMVFSDSIYGSEGRYVCQSRVETMLDYEYNLIIDRLKESRGDQSLFFSYANTIATGSRRRKTESHGWIGVKFQTKENGPTNQVVAHIKMKNSDLSLQREAVGIVGVNLIYACFHYLKDMDIFIPSLMDNLDSSRMEIDFIEFSGENTSHIDNRLMSLKLVQEDFTHSSVFSPEGKILHIGDLLFEKDVLVLRGKFCPVTNVHYDMIEASREHLAQQGVKDPVILLELTLNDLQNSSNVVEQSFVDRIEALNALGYPVLISNYFLFHRLKKYLTKSTQKSVSMVMGANLIPKLVGEQYYDHIEGGVLEGLGQLLKGGTNLFIYPFISPDNKEITFESLKNEDKYKNILNYLNENYSITDISCYQQTCKKMNSEDILKKIQSNESDWESYIPESVVEVIKKRKLFGYNP